MKKLQYEREEIFAFSPLLKAEKSRSASFSLFLLFCKHVEVPNNTPEKKEIPFK
jgi:hypothetical protein